DLAEFTNAGTLIKESSPPTGAENIVIDALDHLFIPDVFTNRVWVYDTSGTLLASWGSNGSGSGQFRAPTGVATHAGVVFVSDQVLDRVQRFDYGSTLTVHPDLVSNLWDWTDHTLHIDLHYDNPSTLTGSLPISGSLYTQPYGAFVSSAPTP